MIVNLSRLGKNGTGMWQYSIKFLDVVSTLGLLSGIICSRDHALFLQRYGVELILVPDWVSNTAQVSRLRPLYWYLYSFWLALRLLFRRSQSTIVSTTHHALPFLRNQVITVHDLRPYDYPDSRLQRIYFHRLLPRALKRCRHILTVSEAVKGKIADYFAYPSNKISVIYNAIDTADFTICRQKDNYLLAVGASWQHKNIDSLLKVSDLWSSRYHLVIVAGRTDYVARLKSYVHLHHLDDKVSFRHEVPFGELSPLGGLSGYASAIIYFSWYAPVWYFLLGSLCSILLRFSRGIRFVIISKMLYVYFVCDTLFRFHRDPYYIAAKMLVNNFMFVAVVFLFSWFLHHYFSKGLSYVRKS